MNDVNDGMSDFIKDKQDEMKKKQQPEIEWIGPLMIKQHKPKTRTHPALPVCLNVLMEAVGAHEAGDPDETQTSTC